MKKVKSVEFTFYSTTTPEFEGLKLVLWGITDTDGVNTYDWGFASWDGQAWEDITVPEGYTAKVVWWANTLPPDVLLKEKNKIITLN